MSTSQSEDCSMATADDMVGRTHKRAGRLVPARPAFRLARRGLVSSTCRSAQLPRTGPREVTNDSAPSELDAICAFR
ncbi:hypothetical protein B296_00054618 [Ensete ventricosum]|uniref:Uncharacterized protein n=1 Tax=Ensete ventricosum TaxID=4639 RepID=A0A426Y321_ENSVE|nr:hypothetical protein B296_00054618 [Ensete ventricosum]